MSKVISKLRCYNPSISDTPARNSSHLNYIAKRSHALKNEFGKTTFGNACGIDVNNSSIDEVGKYIYKKSREKTNIYRGMISMREDEALELGYDKLEEWNILMKNKIYDVANVVNINMSNVEWVGVVHLKKNNIHLHYLMWDKEQQINRYYISTYQQNKIRDILTKYIFENELIKYYEIKNNSKNKLRDNSILLEIKAFNKEFCNGKLAYINFNDSNIKSMIKKFNNILSIIPSAGSLKYSYMSENIKIEIDNFMKEFMNNNVDFKNEYDRYIDNAINIGTLYGKPNKNQIKTKAEQELNNILGNQFLKAIKEIKLESISKKVFIKDLIQELFRTLSSINENMSSKIKLYSNYRSNMSKQAKKDYAKNRENASSINWENN